MNELTKYDAARYALSVAVEVDEVKNIRDKAEAMAAYARQAKDTELVQWATEIKVRAERRAGQMLAEMPKNPGELRNSSRSHDVTATKTLADIGISKNESSRWQKLAAVSETQFEQAVSAAKEVAGEVTTAAMLRAAKADEPQKAKAAPVEPANAPQIAVAPLALVEEYTELDAAHDQISELQAALVVANMTSADADEQKQAAEHIASLQQEIKTLRAINKQLTISRDGFQNQVAEMQKQINRQRREIDRATGMKTA